MPDLGSLTNAYWDDLRAPAQAINPPGAASDPDVDPTTGLLLFDDAATELVFVALQLPHGWVLGSPLQPHVHWFKTTSAAGTVAWRMRYRYANAGSALTDWSAAETVTTTVVSDADTANTHAITTFSDLNITNGSLSMMLLFEIARVGSADTYGADAALLEFDVHHQINQMGSAGRFDKYPDYEFPR